VRIIGHGIDLVEVERIESMLAEHKDRMLERLFTPGERGECCTDGDVRRAMRLAARFAAKEAALKALGKGLADGITWHDVSVENEPGGAPRLLISGRAQEVAAGLGVTGSALSLSHTRAHAIASVILWAD